MMRPNHISQFPGETKALRNWNVSVDIRRLSSEPVLSPVISLANLKEKKIMYVSSPTAILKALGLRAGELFQTSYHALETSGGE